MAKGFKRAMVYLGLSEDDSSRHSEPMGNVGSSVETPGNVTPIRKSVNMSKAPIPMGVMNEISTFHPKKYSEATQIVERFRQGVPVIIDMSQLSDVDARRLIDFASGLSQGLLGSIERVVGKVFLISPQHILVRSGASKEE